MLQPGIAVVGRSGDGLIMPRVIAIAVAAASLGGCSSMPSLSWDYFKPTPPSIQVQLESTPPGADAKTSLGPSCKTPCSVSVPAPDTGFSVTYSLNKFQSATIPVQVIRNPEDSSTPTTTDPNPVFAELQPAGPPPRASAKPMHKPKPKPPNGAASAASPFPDPGAAPARGSSSTR
jgi:hypothetical protein